MRHQTLSAVRSGRHRASVRVASSLGTGRKTQQTCRAVHGSPSDKPFSEAVRKDIVRELSFFKSYHHLIHSLVLVGSTAYGAQTVNSDIDIVVITTARGHEKVCELLFEREIEESLSSTEASKFEYTVLSCRQTEKLFQIASPFAYSICHGVVFQDDGYLASLCKKRLPRLPEKEYYTTCLYENIATPYFGMLKKLQSETRKRGCSLSCRRKNKGCDGLQPAHMFAKLILKMLYVTLPSRGMMPLTKGDVVTYAKKAYGRQGEKAAKQVVSLMRDKRASFCFDEFRMLKKFAVQLFKEILSIVGFGVELREILVDAARVARGDHHLIHNPATKNCVV
ncbi:MAG: nucleotidyltransferase domain-containing protein [Desulfobulbaceae bacterium]|nr:nucleotidyltransferase domain-containing protein [Desulfobulbaceae bacterium]